MTGAFDFSLWGWLASSCSCCHRMMSWSCRGICWFENWSRWAHISLAERPCERMCTFRFAVTTASVKGVIGPPSGSCQSSSLPTSCTSLSATGFLLQFFALSISRVIPWCFSIWSSVSALNPVAGSGRTAAVDPSSGRIWTQRRMRVSRRV